MYRSRIPITQSMFGRNRIPKILLTHRMRTIRTQPSPKPVTPKPSTPIPQKKRRPSIKKPPAPSKIRMKKNFEAMRKKLKNTKLRTARQSTVINTTVTNLFKALENAPNRVTARKIFMKGSLKLHPNKGGNENTYKRFKNIYERKA